MVDYSDYDEITENDTEFVDLCKNVLCKDNLFYPVFLPNGFIDILTIRNRNGKCRVAQDTTKKYGSNILEWATCNIGMEFSVFKMKEKSNNYMLESIDKLYVVMIVVDHFRIKRKSYIKMAIKSLELSEYL
jgi:hypothetical protein